MKLGLLLFYFALIVAGGVYIVARRDEPRIKLVATHELPANHLLQPGEVSLHTDGTQYYVTGRVEANVPFDAGVIQSVPGTAAGTGLVPFALAVEKEQVDADGIDAGQWLVVCPPKVDGKVRAVFCGGAAALCVAVVNVAAADAEKLAKIPSKLLSLKKVCG